jgi:predicted RND superfamily exporter protein
VNLYRTIILRGWWLILLILLAAAILLVRFIPHLDVDAGTSILLNDDDADLVYYNESRVDWGYDEYAIFCVTRDDWFTPDGVEDLKKVVADLREVPHVLSTVSALDVPLLRQRPAKRLNPLALLQPKSIVSFLGDPKCDLARARDELAKHKLALGNLISDEARSLSVLVYLDVPEETVEMDRVMSKLKGRSFRGDAEAAKEIERLEPRQTAANNMLRDRRNVMIGGVRELAEKWKAKLRHPVRLSGVSVINVNLIEHVTYDLKVFGVASFAFFTLAFLVAYRRSRFVILPVLTCLLPVVIVVGTMSWQAMKVTVISSNLPVLLFVLMLPYTIYFIERYRERRALDPNEEGPESTFQAARAVWTPCFFSCTTTMAGFASLMTSGVRPVRTFGTMMTVGMIVGLCIVFLCIPSLSRPLKGLRVARAGAQAGTSGLVRIFEALALKVPVLVVIFSALLLGFAAWGATKLNAETKFTEYFWEGSEVYEGLEYIDQRMGGTTSLEIMLRSDKEEFFKSAEGLAAIGAAEKYFERVPETGNVRSLKSIVDEVRKTYALEHNKWLTDAKVVDIIGMLQPALVREFSNKDFTVSRVFIRMQETAPTLHRNNIIAGLRDHLEAQPELEGLTERTITGVFLLYANMLNSLIESQKQTFLIVILAIFTMLVILFRSFVLGVLVLLPQVLPAVVMLGIMGWAGIPLDVVTVMIASIAMGVGIDAAIQYTMRYRLELEVDGDRRAALSRAHATIGRAIWIATSIIVAGFCVLMLSKFVPSVWFGLFTAIAMLLSQFAALTCLPSIFLLTGYPKPPKIHSFRT